MKVIGIIPARFASSRFPGKPLAMIEGKSMIERVYQQAKSSRLLEEVLIATDDERIADHVKQFGAPVVMTKAEHPSGTDRCYEAYQVFNKTFDYVLNIQGDEPFLDPAQIDEMANACDGKNEIITQMTRCHDPKVLFDLGEVKIAINQQHEALYFSRQVIPAIKNQAPEEWHLFYPYFRHVGMYAYRVDVLESICTLGPSSLELVESLEQLRWLENGFKIKCVETRYDSHGVDTPEDIAKVLALLHK